MPSNDKTTEREWLALCGADAARQGGNAIEAVAWALRCDRHRPFLRGCVWRNNAPCDCRTTALEGLSA